jgi:hypothetical protein
MDNLTDKKPKSVPNVFETRDVVRLTGIPTVYLNKLVERGSFGIRPSGREGTGRGSRRWFWEEDVRGIVLVWALFQAGLRAKVIAQVLNKLTKKKWETGSRASDAAHWIWTDTNPDDPGVLVIRRALGRSRGKDQSLSVRIEDSGYAPSVSELSSEILIPVGLLFRDLSEKIQKFRPLMEI